MLFVPRRRLSSHFKTFVGIAIVSFVLLFFQLSNLTEEVHVRYPPQSIPPYVCPRSNETYRVSQQTWKLNTTWKTDAKVLVFVETLYSKLGKQIVSILDAVKVPRKVETLSKNLPLLTTAKRGRFSIIIIENYYRYLNLPAWNRQLLDKYCRDYHVGIISFIGSRANDFVQVKVKDAPLTFKQRQRAANVRFSDASRVNFLAKPGAVLDSPIPSNEDWVLFDLVKGYEGVVIADNGDGIDRAAVVLDTGAYDGIERVLFGQYFSQWINKIAFVDSLRYMSKGWIELGLERYVQIDIDDIFVGVSGSRMTRADADALLASQQRLRSHIQNFTYCLGFSGHYFRNGDALEDEGDERLIELGKNFVWFPHMWRHNHAHEHNLTYLEAIMTQNKLFAIGMGLPVSSKYSVSPQHAGVYPVHEALYTAWRSVWDIRVTSTEEYPHFRPPSARRGFIYRNISVLPRQTCGLYTHTHFFHSYPEGFSKLISNIEGGDLFFTILINPFSIFMTHQQNYANDRLGVFTFERVIEFIHCWTHLTLKWAEPVATAEAYFRRFPAEKMPVWSNPCSDVRHARILPSAYNCSEMPLPNLLIVGPQKTGSTALASYLALHPNFSTNVPVPSSFEELQFFGGANYARGIQWYMDQFRPNIVSGKVKIFEKSATYFDNSEAPHTAAALVPRADIVMILVDPAMRAYSWYQHMRAHNDSTALGNSLSEILKADTSSPLSLRKLRQRCISPGRYAHHIERWLDYFPLSQVHLVDGEKLRESPAAPLTRLVASLNMPAFPFDEYLKYDEKKGFFCIRYGSGPSKCLGSSKGRKYPQMDEELQNQLDSVFREDNIALHKLLVRNDLSVPSWLRARLSHSHFDQ